jgi:serine/threonine-protein kinase
MRALERECPPELDEIVVAATASDRAKRPTARELAERIERFLDGDRDLALRKGLAAGHIAAARAALAAGAGTAERALAMREAGRAIALDPRSDEAAELVGRLMLEPPRETPPEVEIALARSEEQQARGKLRMLSFSLLTFLGIVPACLLIGLRSWTSMAWLVGAIVINWALTVSFARRNKPPMAGDIMRSAVVYGVLVAVIAREFSPFLMAPAIAAISVMLFLVDPRAPFAFIVVSQTAAVLLPWIAELVGLAPRTIASLPNGDIVLHSAAVYGNIPQVELGLAAYVVVTTLAAGYVSRQLANAQRAEMKKTELQAWHLRQLVRS